MIKHKLLTGLFCLFQLVFFAQNAAKDLEMEYDKKTGLLFSELPFDVNFNLKVKIDINDTIDSILYKNTNKNNGVIRLRSRFQFKKRTNEKELNFYIKPIEGNIKEKYLVLEMDPLAPKTRYEIIIRKKFSSDILKEITKIYDLFKKNEDGNAILKKIFKKEVKISNDSTLKDEKTRKFYQSLYDEIKSNTVGDNFKNDKTAIEIYKQYFEILKLKYGTNNISSILKTKNNDTYKITAYKNIYDAKFKGEYDNLDVSEFDNNEIINELINTTTLVRILYLFKEGKEVYADAKKFESSLKLISNLKSLKNKLILEILEGKGTLFHNSDDELISEFDLFNRINNIKLNTTILTNYIEDLKSIRLFGSFKTDLDVDIEVVIKNLKNLILILNKNKDKLNKIIQIHNGFTKNYTTDYLYANTLISTISSESTRLITPDFGLVFAFENGQIGFFRPFLGANINFGPVNKDIRTSFMTKETPPGQYRLGRWLRQNTSLMLGVTLGSISKENVRDDLFNGVNLLTGLSVRFNRITRFSGGFLWYNSINPNPTVSDKKISNLGYLSISFDIDLKNASGSTFGKLF